MVQTRGTYDVGRTSELLSGNMMSIGGIYVSTVAINFEPFLFITSQHIAQSQYTFSCLKYPAYCIISYQKRHQSSSPTSLKIHQPEDSNGTNNATHLPHFPRPPPLPHRLPLVLPLPHTIRYQRPTRRQTAHRPLHPINSRCCLYKAAEFRYHSTELRAEEHGF